MEAAEDVEFLEAIEAGAIAGALVGVESVTPEGLKEILQGLQSRRRCPGRTAAASSSTRRPRARSFIFGLSTDREATFEATLDLAKKADLTFAQFVTLTPFPGAQYIARWEASLAGREPRILDVPVTRHWLIPYEHRPKLYTPHPMSADDIRQRTQLV